MKHEGTQCQEKGDSGAVKYLRKCMNVKIVLNFHTIIYRYPTFLDAIRDLDDCLSLCFLYASLPKGKGAPVQVTSMARRLTTEFMHYIIEAKALRKVFISIKGIYYQAEVKGQLVTWVVPHSLGYKVGVNCVLYANHPRKGFGMKSFDRTSKENRQKKI